MQDDRSEVRLADLYSMDEEINALGYRYYTLEPRPIPYRSPNTSTHPATVKAKEAADGLNQAYLDVTTLHQDIRSKLNEFKKRIGHPEYSDLPSCFVTLKKLPGGNSIRMECSSLTDDPIQFVGGSKEVEGHLKVFNEMLDLCHQFLEQAETSLETIEKRIKALRMLAVMQLILSICSTFESQAASNVNIFSTEIWSLLLDVRTSAKHKLEPSH